MSPAAHHKELLAKIKLHARKTDFDIGHYVGTLHPIYNVPIPMMRKIAKTFATEHKDISETNCTTLIDTLFHAPSFEEKVLATMILNNFPAILTAVPAASFDRWMGTLTGWAEVDIFCDEVDYWLRANPTTGVKLLRHWNKDPYLEKRRASLVVLCSSVRYSPDPQWKTLAFSLIGTLTHEKHVMITKAISWILRAMIKHHKNDVAAYLKTHSGTLPKIAVREATKKLLTGRKT